MRKLKWNGFSLFSALFLALFATIFSFLLTENVSAVSLSTASFDLRTNVTGAYSWKNNILYGESNGVVFPFNTGITTYQFNTTPVNITGNYATIDFYTNLVATQYSGSNWVNLNLMGAGFTCVAPNVQSSVERKSYETFVTPWTSLGSPRATLTVHGTVVLKLSASSGSSTITCAWGNSNYQFYRQSISNALDVKVYFESGGNTVDVTFTSNVDDALLQAQIQNQNTMINQNNQIIQGQKDQTNAINNQTQQEKDQYDQEKQEEQDRENQGNEDADQMAGLFDFTFVNPFYFLAAGFTPGNTCVSIPTIAGMLNTDQTTFCPFFSQETRNIVTPVLTMFTMIILFGFLVSWLGGNAFSGSVDNTHPGQRRLF